LAGTKLDIQTYSFLYRWRQIEHSRFLLFLGTEHSSVNFSRGWAKSSSKKLQSFRYGAVSVVPLRQSKDPSATHQFLQKKVRISGFRILSTTIWSNPSVEPCQSESIPLQWKQRGLSDRLKKSVGIGIFWLARFLKFLASSSRLWSLRLCYFWFLAYFYDSRRQNVKPGICEGEAVHRANGKPLLSI
jgi:hypothetical protein